MSKYYRIHAIKLFCGTTKTITEKTAQQRNVLINPFVFARKTLLLL